MYLIISGIIISVFLALLGIRIIIRALPNTLSEKLLRDVESTCQMGTVVSIIGGPKTKMTFWRRFEIGLMVLSHTHLLSKLIGREHRMEVATFSRKILEKIPASSTEATKPSNVLFAAARQTALSIIHEAESNKGDHLELLRRITEIGSHLEESLNQTKMLDEIHSQIGQSIKQLLTSNQTEIMETANVLVGTLHQLERELSQIVDFDPVGLFEKIRSMDELLGLCLEVANESSSLSGIETDDWIDHYDLLKIQTNASASEIKTAYRQCANQFHPDRKKDEMNRVSDPDIREEIERTFNNKMVQINLAYQTLSDPDKRSVYDLEYHQRKG